MDKRSLIITILIALACGLAANLGTPLVKSFYLRGLFLSRKAKAKELRHEIEVIDYYLNDRNALYLHLFKEVFRVMFWFLLGMVFLLLSNLDVKTWPFRLSFIPMAFALGRASGNVSFTRHLRDSERYKQKLLARAAKLETRLSPSEATVLPKGDQ